MFFVENQIWSFLSFSGPAIGPLEFLVSWQIAQPLSRGQLPVDLNVALLRVHRISDASTALLKQPSVVSMVKVLCEMFCDPFCPDADNTCKLPFFYNGVWFENCTLSPKDDYWCPTGGHFFFNAF